MENFDYHLSKGELDLPFLCKCDATNVIPNFPRFCLANSHLSYSSTYRFCQLNLLREKIHQKRSTLRSFQKEFSSLKASLQYELDLIDSAHFKLFSLELMTRFWIQEVQLNRKGSINFYRKALKTIPKNLLLNFCKYALSNIEKKLLSKGLNFCLPTKELKHANYLVIFEWFYRDFRNLEIAPNEDLNVLKTKTKETVLSSFR